MIKEYFDKHFMKDNIETNNEKNCKVMPKSSETDRTEGYNKPEGETKTSDSWPTTISSPNKMLTKSQRKKAKVNAKVQDIKNVFANKEIIKREVILKGIFDNPVITIESESSEYEIKRDDPLISAMQCVIDQKLGVVNNEM